MTRAMRWLPAAAVLCLGLTAGARPDDPPLKFERHASPDGRYAVRMPGRVTTQAVDVNAPQGKLKVNVAAAEVSKELGYLVMYNDYPEAAVKAPAQDVLKGVRDGSKGADGKVLDDREVTFGAEKYPGRAFLLEKPMGGKPVYYRATVYLVGPRLYQLAVVGSAKDAVTGKDAQTFYDSFELMK